MEDITMRKQQPMKHMRLTQLQSIITMVNKVKTYQVYRRVGKTLLENRCMILGIPNSRRSIMMRDLALRIMETMGVMMEAMMGVMMMGDTMVVMMTVVETLIWAILATNS